MNVTSTTKAQIVLKFPILSYPPPDSMSWQRISGENWVNVSSSRKYNISKLDQIVSLTIFNLTEKDFGQYRLIIRNANGSYVQSFNVIKEGKIFLYILGIL